MSSQLIALIILLILSAIFSGSETALVSLTKSKVDELVSKGVSNSKLLRKLKKDPNKLLITVLIGNNLVNIAASAYATVIFTEIFGSSGVGVATGVMTFFILVFGEITPKSFAHQHAVGFSLLMAKPIYGLQILLFPFVWLFEKLVILMNKVFGKKQIYTVTEGELVEMLKIGAKEGAIDKQEKELIENVFEFNDIQVKQVMTPRVALDALESEMSLKEAKDFVKEHTHSRIPVYEKDLDNIIGIISIKDILKYIDELPSNKKLKDLDLPVPLEVPVSKKINVLFKEFQKQHVHIAIVIDEYGGTAGLVTLEDLLEELVGDIVDETDIHENAFEIVDKNTIIVKGTTELEDVNDFLKLKFWENEKDTVNTMVLEHLQRFPKRKETIDFPYGEVEIIKMKKNVIQEARITKKPLTKR